MDRKYWNYWRYAQDKNLNVPKHQFEFMFIDIY